MEFNFAPAFIKYFSNALSTLELSSLTCFFMLKRSVKQLPIARDSKYYALKQSNS